MSGMTINKIYQHAHQFLEQPGDVVTRSVIIEMFGMVTLIVLVHYNMVMPPD
ncbi:hypothetical protein F0Z19_3792 [Vibrio cyclitrophicus]|nr:hypothetical protein F0Z19_3792 [Vibrio cyclitrophicus]